MPQAHRDLYQPFTKTDAGLIGDKIGINWSEVEFSVDQFLAGLNVELEHGTKSPETNLTDDDPLKTGKIAWAHLNEKADYYDLLAQVEQADSEENTMQPKQAASNYYPLGMAKDFDRQLEENTNLFIDGKIGKAEFDDRNYDLWDQAEQAGVGPLLKHLVRQQARGRRAALRQAKTIRQASSLVPFVLTSEEADAWAGFDRSSFSTFYGKLKERPNGSARGQIDFYAAYSAARSLESKLATGHYPDLSQAEEGVLLNLGSRLEATWRKARGENTASARQAVVQRCRPTDCPDKDPKDKRWCLLTHDKKRALKCAPSREEAAEHEKSVNYFSHQGSARHTAQTDMEFAVDDSSGQERIFRTFEAAAGFAVTLAVADGQAHNVDVLVWSAAGAQAYGGDDAVTMYLEDPEASIFERIEIKANSVGRVA